VPSLLRALALAVAFLLSACSVGAPSASAPPSSGPALVPLTVGLGFIPSVQFAPFYLAQQEGFYGEAGVEVTFQNKIDPDLIQLVGQGAVDVGLADGTSVIPAASQGIPIRYVATVYRAFPSVVFAKADSGIETAADLEGRSLGIPGRYGSSWIMLQALLDSAGLTPDDLDITEYPDFGQGIAVQQDQVDAATGFINNEPVQLALTDAEPVVLQVDDIVPLPGPGLITGEATVSGKRDALRGFVAATLRAMEAIAADPERGLEAAFVAVPDLAQQREAQAAILDATVEAWRGDGDSDEPLGTIDPAAWEESIAYLTELELVETPITPEDVLDASLLPAR
jgi:NitT/TauT family transport system substrate-binding protein